LTRIGSIFCGSGWVSHLWFGFELGKVPLIMSNFQIFSLRVKKNLFGSGQKVQCQRRVGLLFTAGRK